MIPILFFTLCVSFAGVDDCSYEWITIPSELIPEWYLSLGGTREDVELVSAFYVPQLKLVVVSEVHTIESIIHEREHILCELEWKDETMRKLCNMKVDLPYLTQSTRPQDATPTPPLISEKLAYSSKYQW